jgi:hypothetical protein
MEISFRDFVAVELGMGFEALFTLAFRGTLGLSCSEGRARDRIQRKR